MKEESRIGRKRREYSLRFLPAFYLMKRLTGWRNLCCAANNILREYGFKEGLFTENASFAESVQKNEKLFYQLFRLFQLWEVFCSGNQGVLDSWIDFTVLLNGAFDIWLLGSS